MKKPSPISGKNSAAADRQIHELASYGQIAKLAGYPGHARQVVWALHSSTKKHRLPWHRILNAQGKIGLTGIDQNRQRLLLEKEGVRFNAYGKTDLS